MIETNLIYYLGVLSESTCMICLYNGRIIIVDPLLFWVEWAFLGAFHPSTSSIPLTSALGAMTIIDPWLTGSKMGALKPP